MCQVFVPSPYADVLATQPILFILGGIPCQSIGPGTWPAPSCAAVLLKLPVLLLDIDQCQLPLHMYCDLEFLLILLFRFLLMRDDFGDSSTDA